MKAFTKAIVDSLYFSVVSDTNSRTFQPPSEEELVPPLEHCIRTKYVFYSTETSTLNCVSFVRVFISTIIHENKACKI